MTNQKSEWLNLPATREDLLKKFAGDEESVKLFITNIITAVANNPKLAECSYASVVTSGLAASQLKLSISPSLGHAAIVPYGKTASLIIQVRGYKQLALRTGQYVDIIVREVRAGEFKGLSAKNGAPVFSWINDYEERRKAEVIGYMSCLEMVGGYCHVEYMSKQEVLEHADRYSPSFSLAAKNGRVSYKDYCAGKVAKSDEWKYGKWYTDTDEMGEKTVLKRNLMQNGLLSIELQKAIEEDSDEVNDKKEEEARDAANNFFDAEYEETPTETVKEEVIDDVKPTKKRGKKPEIISADEDKIAEDATEGFFGV